MKLGFLRSDNNDQFFPPPHLPFPSGTGEIPRTSMQQLPCSPADAGMWGRFRSLDSASASPHPQARPPRGPVPFSAPLLAAVSRSGPAGETTRYPHWWADRNVGEEESNGLGGKPRRPGKRSQTLRTQKATQEPFTSDSRQDMNFKTTCLRYSKLISRASVRSALFMTEGAMFGISGPGLSRTSKSSLSGLIF